jgi:hypothetical protein
LIGKTVLLLSGNSVGKVEAAILTEAYLSTGSNQQIVLGNHGHLLYVSVPKRMPYYMGTE